MLIRDRVIPSAAVVMAAAALLSAQQQSQQTIRVGVRTVPVYATVTDRVGRFVLDLQRDDFEIRDNGKPVEIGQFTMELTSISAVLMLDGSRSVIHDLDTLIFAADAFITRMRPGDQGRIGSFSEELVLSPRFTKDRDELLRYLHNEFNLEIGNRTRLWDAIDQAAAALAEIEGRRVVVVFTDGRDTWSVERYDDVLGRLNRRNVMLYVVEMRTSTGLREERAVHTSNAGVAHMARQTGGGRFAIDTLHEINSVFTRITTEIHSQYLLGFTPQALDGKVHELDVRVKRDEYRVRARETYIASEDGKGAGGVR